MSKAPIAACHAVDVAAVRAAADRIAAHAHRTPILTSRTLDDAAGRRLFFKCENFQKGGAFKFRGACNAVLALSDEAARPGVLTHSSGNFAQALALAARIRGIAAHIVMPDDAAAVKRLAAEGYGATIHTCRPTLASREATAKRVADETGATFVHPFDDPHVIAGQGTCGLELLEELPDLDAVIAPIGGGGLMSGVCIAVRGLAADVRLFAAEPAGADDAARSMAAGALVPQTSPDTVADGLLTSLGELTWPIVRDHVEQVITVSDPDILAAMRLVAERMKIVIEPSAAVAVAAALSRPFVALAGLGRVGVVLSGGNVDLARLG